MEKWVLLSIWSQDIRSLSLQSTYWVGEIDPCKLCVGGPPTGDLGDLCWESWPLIAGQNPAQHPLPFCHIHSLAGNKPHLISSSSTYGRKKILPRLNIDVYTESLLTDTSMEKWDRNYAKIPQQERRKKKEGKKERERRDIIVFALKEK